MRCTSAARSGSRISAAMEVKPSTQPSTASAVCRGLRHVVTFMRSTRFTVSRSVRYTPAAASGGLPAGNASSTTRYSGTSALTNGAMYVPRPVTMGSMPSTPSSVRRARTSSAGRGVILSIIVSGKLTLRGSRR
ncbi:hypothetical protein SDC9_182202 [bioreactor metagenome]|uniref:Uncharacterized protein n=1 Tax=bioreactor metagenome TaxID=1076179 RepID=A0A645H6W3_9ZZZZ